MTSRACDAATATATGCPVDIFGFLAPHAAGGETANTTAADTQATLCTSWSAADLRREESWWASDFLLYLSWKAALLTATAESSDASADTTLIERWFWGRWGDRLRVHGGCPHMSLRPLFWGFFSGAWQRTAAEQEDECARYASMSGADESSAGVGSASPGYVVALEAIDRDVGRTLPDHVLFRGEAAGAVGQGQLRRLLRAYAVQDPEVGYCQGMAFVAAVVLMVAPELQAFQILCGLMRESGGGRHGMRQLYCSGFPLLQTLLGELERHVHALLPALAAHLQSTEVHIAMFASRWLLTLFVHQLSPPVLLRVWDFFLVRGWSVMVQVAVALLHQEQDALLRLDMEGILLHLKVVRSRSQGEGELLRRVCNVPQL